VSSFWTISTWGLADALVKSISQRDYVLTQFGGGSGSRGTRTRKEREMAIFRVSFLCCLWAVHVGQVSAQVPPLRHDLSQPAGSGAEAVAFSPDGKLLAVALNEGELRLLETRTGKLLVRLDHKSGPGHYVQSRAMAFSPDGKTLAVGVETYTGILGRILLWDVEDGRALKRRTVLKEKADVVALAFTPDGKTLISAVIRKRRTEREIRLCDIATGKSRLLVRAHDMVLSADGRVLVTASLDEVKVWNPKTNKETASWKIKSAYRRGNLALSPDGKILAIWKSRGGITFWDVATGKRRADLKPLPGVPPMAFSPDGRRFVSTERGPPVPVRKKDLVNGPIVRIMDVATGRELAKYRHGGQFITIAAWSPDGKLIASGDYSDWGHWFASLLLRDVSRLAR